MEELDLNTLRSTGLQAGETELTEDASEEQVEGIRTYHLFGHSLALLVLILIRIECNFSCVNLPQNLFIRNGYRIMTFFSLLPAFIYY